MRNVVVERRYIARVVDVVALTELHAQLQRLRARRTHRFAIGNEIDYGRHRVLTLLDDGRYRHLSLGECEDEPLCFGAAPPDLCDAYERQGTWSVHAQYIRFDGDVEWELREDQSTENSLHFAGGDGYQLLRAATCQDQCLEPF